MRCFIGAVIFGAVRVPVCSARCSAGLPWAAVCEEPGHVAAENCPALPAEELFSTDVTFSARLIYGAVW